LAIRGHRSFRPTVLRFATLPDGTRDVGSLAVFRPGRERQRGYLDAVPDQAAAGAFFDALIGQQDRNDGNILWYDQRRLIYLIDHAFSFARPGANSGEVILTAWRAQQDIRDLTRQEVDALSRLADEGWGGLSQFVEPSRMEALVDRAERMQRTRQMLPLGSF